MMDLGFGLGVRAWDFGVEHGFGVCGSYMAKNFGSRWVDVGSMEFNLLVSVRVPYLEVHGQL